MEILIHVASRPGCTMKDISDRAGVSLSTVSRNLRTLGREGRNQKKGLNLIRTVPDPAEPRRLLVYLTPKGAAFVNHVLGLFAGGERPPQTVSAS